MTEGNVIYKRSARGIVRDLKGRILLLNWRDPKNGREVWEVPGGSVEGKETLEEALVRELREETGYINIQVGKPVWTRSHSFTWADQKYSADETFSLCDLMTEDCVLSPMTKWSAAGTSVGSGGRPQSYQVGTRASFRLTWASVWQFFR